MPNPNLSAAMALPPQGEGEREIMLPLEQQFKEAFRATGLVTNTQAWELSDAAMTIYRAAILDDREAGRARAAQAEPTNEHQAVPLVEPVTIHKAMLAHRPAEVWLNGGTGPSCCVALVNIQIEPWNRHTPTEAKAFADGFNLAAKWMRNALATPPAAQPPTHAASPDVAMPDALLPSTPVRLTSKHFENFWAANSHACVYRSDFDRGVQAAEQFFRPWLNIACKVGARPVTPVSQTLVKAAQSIVDRWDVRYRDFHAYDSEIESLRTALAAIDALGAAATQASSAVGAERGRCMCQACKAGTTHASDCAVHGIEPGVKGPCDCEVEVLGALRHAKEALREAEFLLHKVYTNHGIVQIDGEDGAWVFVSKAADRMDQAIDVVQRTIECFDCEEVSCICDDVCNGRVSK